ncbi:MULTISPECIES: YijD family membrane protein [Providencia]|uniref:YijD family membrane protein n=1 Tax=Providencia rettgeri TaxID=587 RepID=A0AAD2ZKR4_PRORE|nr:MULTISPECIES: YijD family membrane protein [Providencia]ELR5071899.1 YijD family membrane protein [Providencia rettgeri]ELR5218253.1 YijD family membrane protein [Providencia rettgeri]ELR5223302.1 YijD family membrane protein [Providencia rettgeri]MDX7323501.1 YijD family membrane protein [Providencia rettgeri]HEC8326374.1 YijD family membrane protein [Providencia rettgeri]
MTDQKSYERSTLLLAFVIGLATHGTFSTLFNSLVDFSFFPILTLILAVYCLHQRYLHQAMPIGLPKFVAGSFFIGLFGYAAILRVQNPEIGSNFIPATFIVIIALWMYSSWKARKKEKAELALEQEVEN